MLRKPPTLTIARQFVIVALIFTLAVLVLAALLVRSHSNDVELAERELDGVAMSRDLFDASRQLRRATFEAMSANTSAPAALQQLSAGVRDIGRQLGEYRKEAEGESQLARELALLDEAYSDLYRYVSTMNTEGASWDNLLDVDAKVRKLSSRMGDATGLILDPELPTYYLMELFLLTIPRCQTRLLEFQAASQREHTSGTRLDGGFYALLRSDWEDLGASVDAAIAALRDSDLDGATLTRLDELMTRARQATERLLDATTAPVTSPSAAHLATLSQHVMAALTLLDELQVVAVSRESELLERRISTLRRDLQAELAVAALLLGLAYAMGIAVAHSVVRRIDQLRGSAEAYAAGAFDAAAEVKGSDEVAELASVFNALALRVTELTADLRAKAEGLSEANKRLEELVRARTAELATRNDALDKIAVVAETDSKGRLTYVNDKFVELSKYPREELIGHTHRIVNSGHHPREFFQDMWRTISRGQAWHGEIKNRAKDGTYYWVETWLFPQQDSAGHVEKYVAIRLDITERKAMDERLVQAKLDAESALQAKSVFLANMSHEVRTPLNGILGAAELILRSPSFQEKDQMAQLILNSGHSLMVIINDILDYSKLASGKMVLERVPLDLHDLLRDAVSLFDKTAQERGLTLETKYPERAPRHILGDPTRLRQIVLNLLSNAIKFTHRGTITCSATFTHQTESHAVVRIAVQDTGIGMTEEQLARIFERFAQADASTTRVHGGTGLGTSISQGLAALMQGSIGATSELDVGSTFTLTLPVELTQLAVPEAPRPTQLQRRYNRRVLLVEDNVVNQKIGMKILEGLGLQVTLAKNGAEAVDLAREVAPHLVLMDIQMPIMDGLEASRRLIASGFRSPIVAMTANVMQEDLDQYARLGMVGYIPKPFQIAQVIRILDQYLSDPLPISSVSGVRARA